MGTDVGNATSAVHDKVLRLSSSNKTCEELGPCMPQSNMVQLRTKCKRIPTAILAEFTSPLA